MKTYKCDFIAMAIKANALCFGDYVLKSGRHSPYFFNAGKFYYGTEIANLGRFYSKVLIDSRLNFDMLFGPAYKGIPLAAVTVAALADQYQVDVPYCYNRKEAKDHGEGGTLVGAPLKGAIAIVDDVITAGTAIREVLSVIKEAGASPAAIVVGLDRQERGTGGKSAIQELQDETGVPVLSVVKLADIMQYLEQTGDTTTLEKVHAYREAYGIE